MRKVHCGSILLHIKKVWQQTDNFTKLILTSLNLTFIQKKHIIYFRYN